MFGDKIGRNYRLDVLDRNLVKTVLEAGGNIVPLIINPLDSKGLGLCNPSVFIDNGKPMMILRNINYTLYHAENTQAFNSRYGPLSYLNPENDIHLRTWNYLCELNPKTLAIDKYWKIDTSKLDKEPLWEFIGLEDARLVRWNEHLYGIGVRRDTTTNGQGRMEFSQMDVIDKIIKIADKEITDKEVKEITRNRIENTDPKAYCEKNWMPILDMPNCFAKWVNPTAIVEVDLETNTSKHIYHGKDTDIIPGLPFLRGGTQVVSWGEFRFCLVHECDLFSNVLEQKDATYLHRFVVWDKSWNVVKITEPFSFMDGEIEFCCGAAIYEEDLLLTFGFQDNAAYLLRIPKHMIPKVLGLVEEFDWGLIEENQWFKNGLIREIDIEDQYQKYFKVEEGDVVLDLGASVGPFAVHILGAAPSKIICVEPHNDLFKTLVKNTARSTIVTCINKGIAGVNEEVETSNLFDPSVGVESNKVFKMNGIRFNTLVEDIQDIDFLKIDIEGGEYDVFTEDNLAWIAVHVKKIAGELHLHTPEQKEKFRRFRDLYFKAFPNFQVHANNGANIKFQIWDDNFADLYGFINFYIDNRPNRWSVTPWASLEITTILPKSGCPIDCLYCPQDALQVYDDPVRVLTVEDFKKLIDKVPKEIIISFAGFTEPFLNGGCADMIIYAHEQGHKISLFTTAIGMSMDDFFKIRHIPFGSAQGGFVLHLPDVEGYSKHVITPAYMNLLSQIMTSGMAYQAISMGTPPENIRAMFPEYTKQAMWWRAGNLNVTGTYNKADIKSGLTTCGCQEKVYHNVLLPNGDISLCCMDYGLKHILGNLHKQEYNDIIPVYNESFELCKYCENGVSV